jgi:hypothetical protein
MRQSDPVKMYVETKPLGETIMEMVDLNDGELESPPGDQTEFISDLMIVTENNKLRFLCLGEREVQISSKVVQIPGDIQKVITDEYSGFSAFL